MRSHCSGVSKTTSPWKLGHVWSRLGGELKRSGWMIGASERAETTNRDLQSRDAERLHGVDRRSGLAAEKMNPVTGQTHEEGEAWLRPTVTEEKQYTEREHPSSIEVFKCWNQFVASGV
ncbi:hypothetical protein Bca52824_087891 [Brassica carinata]|uniref:Uncharacterized protein n=1 Tax=Brassica carinata TaxID=52824 RepID=A0A8X7PCF2_BRACI|nr:hypothetical protein Bca52824_087891 [Brassica carinata]